MSPEAKGNFRNLAGKIRQGIDFINSGAIYRFIVGQPDIKMPKGRKMLLPYFKARDIHENDKHKTSR